MLTPYSEIDTEKNCPSYNVDGIVKWYNCCGKQYGNPPKVKRTAQVRCGGTPVVPPNQDRLSSGAQG